MGRLSEELEITQFQQDNGTHRQEKPEIIIIGTGQFGIVRVPLESEKLAKEQDIEVVKARTQQAVRIFNEAMKQGKRVSAVIHVTC